MAPKYNEGDVVKIALTGDTTYTIQKVHVFDIGNCYTLEDYEFMVSESDITEVVD